MCRWASLPLSLVGRINLVKMVILPKFLYLFQHLPICMNKSFFNGFDGLLRSFLWGNKPARLKKSILQLPKAKGGLALPNFQQYYWACNIHKLLFWNRDSYSDNCPPWVHTETSLTKSSLYSIVGSQLPLVLSKVSNNPVVTNTLKIWVQFGKHYGLHKGSFHMPMFDNYFFPIQFRPCISCLVI